jgi:hypothetical protein
MRDDNKPAEVVRETGSFVPKCLQENRVNLERRLGRRSGNGIIY